MNTEKTGGAAFPIHPNKNYGFNTDTDGMTLLDYFAAKSLPTILESIHSPYTVTDMQVAARDSYRQAVAMIEERKKYINQ